MIFAGSASPSEHGASQVILLLSEITLLDCITSEQAITEVERNLTAKLTAKLPAKLPDFRLLISHCVRIVPDPEPGDLLPYSGQADLKDLPLLVAALREQSSYLLTFNVRHYFPITDTIHVQRPGEFLQSIRRLLSQLGLNS